MKKEKNFWNYRIIRRKNEHPEPNLIPEYYYQVHEVYYIDNKPDMWTDNPKHAFGESKKDVIECLEMMLKDAKKYPVMEEQKNKFGKNILVEVEE